MTERGTKTLIGAFVMGAIVLLITGILLVGTGSLFSKNVSFVLFFDTSLRGLVVGSPVYFKGVRVGKVTSIQISMEADESNFRTPVIIELESGLISGALPGMESTEEDFMNDPVTVTQLIDRGLRARLGLQSFITGQLTVDLDVVRDAPEPSAHARLPFRDYMQIPTLPSSMDAMIDVLMDLPVEDITQEIIVGLRTFNRQLSAMDLPALTASLTALSNEMRNQVSELPIVRQEAVRALHQVGTLAGNMDRELAISMKKLDTSLNSFHQLSQDASKTMNTATRLLREDSAPILELSQTMEALREAATAISSLATMLELKPDSLIFGRVRP